MSRGRIAAAVGIALLVVVGAVLVLLAGDVRSARDAIVAGDAAYAGDPASEPVWRADGALPFRAGERVLGTGGQRVLREAIALYRESRIAARGFDNGFAAATARGRAEAALALIVRFDSDAGRASTAANLLGILAFADARSPGVGSTAPVERAVTEFRNAIRLDSANEDAKFNLELLLTMVAAGQLPVTEAASAGGFGPVKRGSGESPPGRGY